jgi:hypothetical protein
LAPARTIGATMFAMALAGAASGGDGTMAAIGSGSSIAPQAQADPPASAPPKPQKPEKPAGPDDQRVLMLMLLSHTQLGLFGQMGR